MRYWLDSGEAEGGELFGPARGCDVFEQRLLRPGAGEERVDERRDELLYVLSGTAAATIGGEEVELAPGTAAYVPRGVAWRLDAGDVELLSVLVEQPLAGDGAPAVVDVDEAEDGVATAGRMFRLLAPCASATQFVGYIPVGRAPDHYHEYDEVVYVLAGEGELHIEGDSRPLHRGACVHLPRRLVHSLENTGPEEMQVLGVFRPAGSPADAYYPDGTKAVY